MKEQEIRDRIKGFIETVDRGVKKVVLPAALGMGLALSGGGCGGMMDGPQPGTAGKAGKGEWSDVVALYSAPFPAPDAGVTFDLGSPPVALYSAPFPRPDAGMVEDSSSKQGSDTIHALYAAPFPVPDAGVVQDSSNPGSDTIHALYAAPFPLPDAGAVDSFVEPDGEMHALYAAPFPNDDEGQG